jgi:hypothetical protein
MSELTSLEKETMRRFYKQKHKSNNINNWKWIKML